MNVWFSTWDGGSGLDAVSAESSVRAPKQVSPIPIPRAGIQCLAVIRTLLQYKGSIVSACSSLLSDALALVWRPRGVMGAGAKVLQAATISRTCRRESK